MQPNPSIETAPRPRGRPSTRRNTKAMHLHLPPQVHSALLAFAEATDQHASAFVVSFLMEAVPQLQALTEAALSVKQAPASSVATLNRLTEQLSQAQLDVSQLSLELGSTK